VQAPRPSSGRRDPDASGPRRLVAEFVNTRDAPGELAGWLAERGVAVSAAGLSEATQVREALRALLLANNGVEVDRVAATRVLDRAARRARLEPRFADGQLVPRARGAAGAVGAVLAAVHASIADGSWRSLKACRARGCGRAFVDTARNRSRAWCSMRICGNREKVRSYRERRASA
jgi:predicted RNA-binding Zn ribbon-like protein